MSDRAKIQAHQRARWDLLKKDWVIEVAPYLHGHIGVSIRPRDPANAKQDGITVYYPTGSVYETLEKLLVWCEEYASMIPPKTHGTT